MLRNGSRLPGTCWVFPLMHAVAWITERGVVWLYVARLTLSPRLARLLTSRCLLHACPCQVRLVRGCIAVWPFQ